MPSEGIEPPSDCVHEHYETVYSSERHRDERRCVECGAWSPPAIEPPFDCPTCHGTRLVYGPCDCIERFGFHEQGRCPGSWKVRCEACSCDVPDCDAHAQWYVHADPDSKWCAAHGARIEWTARNA